jgi:hypothetical protein
MLRAKLSGEQSWIKRKDAETAKCRKEVFCQNVTVTRSAKTTREESIWEKRPNVRFQPGGLASMLPAATAAILVVMVMVLVLMIAVRSVLMAATATRCVIGIRTALPPGQEHKDKSDEQHEN